MVERSYGLYLCRSVDEGGLISHAKECHLNDMSEEDMIEILRDSQEFGIVGDQCESNKDA